MALNKTLLQGFFALALALTLSACAQTQFAGYDQASDEAASKVNKGEYDVDATAQIAIVQNPDINGGKISLKALMKIEQYSMSCQRQIDPQLAGGVQSGINGVVPYGIGGFVGVGEGAVTGFPGAKFMQYGPYGGIADGAEGGVNGLVTGSYALAAGVGGCTRDFWEDISKSDPAFAGTHVEIVYAGKSWGDSHPPALDKKISVDQLKQ